LGFATISKKPNGKRLNEHQRCEIISKLSKTNAPSKRALAQEYNVSEGTIRKVWDIREAILERSALLYEEAKKKRTFRDSIGRFTEFEDMLYIWIDIMRHVKLPVPSSLAIAKAKSIASSLSILESESFQSKIQTVDLKAKRKKLQNLRQMTIHDMFN
jgi:DNA-binding transcriptional regulator YhcF (GntR family)